MDGAVMRGFEDSTQPVRLFLSAASALGTGPFEIDGAQASLTADGIVANVGDTRYFVPTHLIDHIEQKQTPAATPATPVTNPGQGNGGGNNGGSGGDGFIPPIRTK
jgi:hypothetical protein